MNIGKKAFAFALGVLFVVGVAAVATSAAGEPDKELNAEEASTGHVEIVETNGDNGTFKTGSITLEVNQTDEPETDESDGLGDRVDRYDGEADYYHVPLGAADDERYDHDFDPSEVGPPTEFAGALGYVVEVEKVDISDPRVVAHVAENDPKVDGIFHADEVKTLEVEDENCRENDAGNRVCKLSLNGTVSSE